ncbi:MAG: (2Fe-2S)-binding protein [Epsilonproteobacteria bacterium]|nr:(2Fe-2S)-binding protein [Campylobacterota bacterium]
MTIEELEKLKSDYVVCECYEVSFGDIIEAIENGYDTIEALIYETKASYGCERCQSKTSDQNEDREVHLDEIIAYAKSKEVMS